jgi:hypothetical protein
MAEPEIRVEPAPGRAKKIGILALLAIVLAAALYALGYMQAKKRYETPLNQARGDLESARQQLTDLGARHQMLLARTALYTAAIDLDQRNFGMAGDHVRVARQALQNVSGEAAIAGNPQLQAIREQLSGIDVNVALDVAGQRQQLLALATRLDALMATAGSQ